MVKVKCIKNTTDYIQDKYYLIKNIWNGPDFIFNKTETFYAIYDEYNEIHTFNQLGFDIHFITLQKERKNKLEHLKI